MKKIPSFQLFEIQENYSLGKLKEEDVLRQVKANKDDSQSLKTFIESSKNMYKNLSFEPITQKSVIKMIVDEYTQFQDKQTLWINRERMIIKHNNLLMIGKSERKIERLLQIYLRDSADAKPVIFKDKQLWQIWKSMKLVSNNLEMNLHRLILKKTYIEADKINELNIHAKDVDDLGFVGDLVKLAEQVRAITVRIKGFYSENKWTTIRLDKNGSILIYGKHNSDIIIEFLKLFVKSL